MSTLQHIARTLLPTGLALAAAAGGAMAQTTGAPLALQVYNADENSFNVTAVLVSGKKDAVLLDSGFTRADAYRIAAMILDSKKTLTVIYITQADPDYYFGAEVLKNIFPEAKLIAAAPTVKKMRETVAGKIRFWGDKLGVNAPKNVPMPEVMSTSVIDLEGQKIEVRGLEGSLPHRSYVWIPSLKAVAGGVNVFGGLHAWTADTQTAKERADWSSKLDEMAALKPAVVIPGHMKAGERQNASQLDYTKAYLSRFEVELPLAANSQALVTAMQAAYPNAPSGPALEIGAKVNKGEMKW